MMHLIILMAILLSFVPATHAFAGDQATRPNPVKQLRMGDFKLSITQPQADQGYSMEFSVGEEVLHTAECAFKTNEPKIVHNVPAANCRLLLAYCFSGGAHCCTSLFAATECGPLKSLDFIDIAHSGREIKFVQPDGSQRKAMKVSDWQFAYFGPEDSRIQLSFADSPAMSRLLVFENGHWRVDRPGEFAQFYSRLLKQAMHAARIASERDGPERAASHAIKAAYYALMSGKSSDYATEILAMCLPPKWKLEAPNVIRSVTRAISEFNPVEIIR